MMKFSIGERVKIRGKDIVGEVVQTEYKHTIYKGNEKISKRYLVKQNNSWSSQWYDEDMLESVLELSDTYALEVYNLLIDVNLMVGNFDMVKKLNEEKQKHVRRNIS
jgi:hypothetical protein